MGVFLCPYLTPDRWKFDEIKIHMGSSWAVFWLEARVFFLARNVEIHPLESPLIFPPSSTPGL